MNKEELIYKIGILEQQSEQLQRQLQMIEQSFNELSKLKIDLEDLKNSKGKEIMAPIGRGIFIKSKIIEENLLVDIGSKNLVVKSIAETQELIQEQIKKLHEVQEFMNSSLHELGHEMEKAVEEIQKEIEGKREKSE
ncbi:MAG: prefoldin subunit alpha [Nanoarchaeota archaeon]